MNKKAIFGMGLVSFIALIVIFTIGLTFGLLFGLDFVSNLGRVTQDQVIESVSNINNAHEVILNCLNTKTKFNEKEVDLADLIILSVKQNNYEQLKEELEKNLGLSNTHWLFRINSNEKKLYETKRDKWTTFEESKDNENTFRFNLITPLQNHPNLRLTFAIREGEKV